MFTGAAIALQVWLQITPGVQPAIVVPYIRSSVNANVQYALQVSKSDATGSLTINLAGHVVAPADAPAPLSRFSMQAGPDDRCAITLTLTVNGQAPVTDEFECPR